MPYLKIEIKETTHLFTVEGNDSEAPNLPTSAPAETDFILGISLPSIYWARFLVTIPDYIEEFKDMRIETTLFKIGMPDIQYRIALESFYWVANWPPTEVDWHWNYLGGPEQMIKWIEDTTGNKTSFPDPVLNPYGFYRPDLFQVLPIRELIRRHVTRFCSIRDRDMMISINNRR